MSSTFFTVDDRQAWVDAVAAHLADSLSKAVRDGRALFAVAGGKTPEPILAALARESLGWDQIDIVPTDERLAPDGHAARNVDFLAHCLQGATAAGARVIALETAQKMGLTRPNLVLLGMGADGHIASLFPGAARLESALDPYSGPETVEITPDPLPPEAPFPRLSLTMFSLTCASEIILATTGEAKKQAIEAARRGDPKSHPLSALFAQNRAPVRTYWSP
jgi:6-phosphogluconolactonase